MKILNRQSAIILVIIMTSLTGWSQINSTNNGAIPLKLNIDSVHDMECKILPGETYSILTTGNNPWLLTDQINEQIDRQTNRLSFEYFCSKGLHHLQIFFGSPINEKRSKLIQDVGMSEGWVSYSVDIGNMMNDWGNPGDFLRLDFGDQSDINLQIRNIQLGSTTAREKEIAATKDEKKIKEAEIEKRIRKYLDSSYTSKITEVSVMKSSITISGELLGNIPALLCESAPYQDITEGEFEVEIPVIDKFFNIKIDRFENRNGILYDRMLSRWVLLNEKNRELISHARYPDEIKVINDLPKEFPASRKGLGGFSTGRGHIKDLDELDIASATVNVTFTRFMYNLKVSNKSCMCQIKYLSLRC